MSYSPKNLYRLLGAFVLVLGTWAPAQIFAQEKLIIPYLSGPVIDQSGVLSYAAKEQLSAQIKALPQSQLQFQIWITPTLNGEPIESVAMRAVKEWKLGTEKDDRGLLLLIASQDRQIRFEVGYGLEGDFPDILASRVIERIIGPRLSRGDYEGGMFEAVSVVSQLASGGKDSKLRDELSSQTRPKKKFPLSPFILIVFFIIFNLIFGRRRRRGLLGSSSHWGGWGGGGGFGGGGFGGGGGWSGGGGSFGGGGASGRF